MNCAIQTILIHYGIHNPEYISRLENIFQIVDYTHHFKGGSKLCNLKPSKITQSDH